jgi:hypothetical protein
MNRPAPRIVRRRFFVALGHAVRIAWPILSMILAIQIALGVLIGFVEGWSLGDAVYFTFVTGLTIGYGDIVPRQALGRALAVGIDMFGLFLTGLIAGICALCSAYSAHRRASRSSCRSQLPAPLPSAETAEVLRFWSCDPRPSLG